MSNLQYFDRRPLTQVYGVNANSGAAARAVTKDWEYIAPVPALRRIAIVEALFASIVNDSTVALNAGAFAWVEYTPFGSAKAIVLQVILPTGAQSVAYTESLASPIYMGPGDKLSGWTYNGNTALLSNVQLTTSVKLTEFDS